jgi:hypothetical protein
MVRGALGKFGIGGNVESTSYGSDWTGQGPNPSLSAIAFVFSKRQVSIPGITHPIVSYFDSSLRGHAQAVQTVTAEPESSSIFPTDEPKSARFPLYLVVGKSNAPALCRSSGKARGCRRV